MIRRVVAQTAVVAVLLALGPFPLARGQGGDPGTPRAFRVWVSSDPHIGRDLQHGRESLADAIRDSEQPGGDNAAAFNWDIALMLGDFSGNTQPPDDAEGAELIKQFGALRKHRREDIYELLGNHDASGPDEPTQWWFKKWVDPLGENTRFSGVDRTRRRYPIEGTWDRYSFRVGNLLFLMMGDRNDGGPPIGRAKTEGGYPSGAVTGETFEWWKRQVEANRDAVIVSAHHHMLKETTVASGPWEGYTRGPDGTWLMKYHGYIADGGPEGASYLYWVDGKPDAQAFEKYLAAHPGGIDFWLGGHTHTNPDDHTGGRSHVEKKWGVNFVNCAALTKYMAPKTTVPMSRLFTFVDGSDEVLIQCFLHTDQYAPKGWYKPAERRVKIGKPFRMPAITPGRDARDQP